MNINNDLQGLQRMLAGQEVSRAQEPGRTAGGAAARVPAAVDQATVSAAASLAVQTPADADVRMEKVAAVQQALAAGTYGVSSSEVAGRLMDTMLGR